MKSPSLAILLLLATAPAFAQDATSSSTAPVSSAAQASSTAPATPTPSAHENLYAWWSARTNAIQSKQPAWAVPLVTTYTGLFQVLRFDLLRQVSPARTDTWNFDNSKAVNFIPGANFEVGIDMPPFIAHSNRTQVDGWGDFSFLVKYRFASGNAQHGAYTLSAYALTTVPTGQEKNGSTNASIQPNIAAGKGFGDFDVQSTFGATLPFGTPATTTSGRPILWNAVAQYKVAKILWPEVESNATFYKGGTNDGKKQEFITPGIVIGKCGLRPENPTSRPGLTFGGGVQIATSQFHSYNHGMVLTARWIF